MPNKRSKNRLGIWIIPSGLLLRYAPFIQIKVYIIPLIEILCFFNKLIFRVIFTKRIIKNTNHIIICTILQSCSIMLNHIKKTCIKRWNIFKILKAIHILKKRRRVNTISANGYGFWFVLFIDILCKLIIRSFFFIFINIMYRWRIWDWSNYTNQNAKRSNE